MKKANGQSAFPQGDVIFVPVTERPDNAAEVTRKDGRLIVAHSETGHHHAIDSDDARLFRDPQDPLVAYLSIEGSGAELVHHRAWDTHESVLIPPGMYKVCKQAEYTPEGVREVMD